MRLAQPTFLLLFLASSGCLIGRDRNAGTDTAPEDGSFECLIEGEREEVFIDPADAKVPAPIDAATVPPWRALPDSTMDRLHVIVAGCPYDRQTLWSRVDVFGPSPWTYSVRARSADDVRDASWIEARTYGNPDHPFYELNATVGDLELIVEVGDEGGGAAIDEVVVTRTCEWGDEYDDPDVCA